MAESINKKISRVRKPRVHITYDVETNGAMVKKELAFVVGVMGDYSGDNTASKRSLKERKFVQVDRDNFNDVMAKIKPQLDLKVDNKLTDEPGKQMAVSLEFNSLDDFEPPKIVNQIEPLKQLMEKRNQLRDLMTKVDRSEKLEELFENILQNQKDLDTLAQQVGATKSE